MTLRQIRLTCHDGYEEPCTICGHPVVFEQGRGIDGTAYMKEGADGRPELVLFENKFFGPSNVLVRCIDHLVEDGHAS